MRMNRFCLVGVFAVLVGIPAFAAAEAVDFTLDPLRSTFRLGGTFNDLPLGPQSPGSDVTGYTGMVHADVNRAAGTLSFATLAPQALNQAVDQPPFADSGQGANYGLTHSGTLPIFLAPRGMDLYVNATDAPFNAGAPTFEQVGFFVNGGTLYYTSESTPYGVADLHGYGGFERVVGPLTLTREGALEVLTVPIRTNFTPSAGGNPDVIHFTLEGQLVGTRLVPEPASAVLLAAGSAWLLVRPRRKLHTSGNNH
jgi:hypothetical protein